VSHFGAIIEAMVAHFVCILFTGFVIYTAQPGSSKLAVHMTCIVLLSSRTLPYNVGVWEE